MLATFAGAVAIGTSAVAQSYPWCSSFHDGAGINCGFTSYEQCMATARGTGGSCERNTLYTPPANSGQPSRPVRH